MSVQNLDQSAPVSSTGNAPATEDAVKKVSSSGKKKANHHKRAFIYITTTFNNCVISVTTLKGDVIAWSTPGKVGFKGARQSTPYAAQLASDDACRRAVEQFGVERAMVRVSGPGAGRELAIRSVNNAGIIVESIEDVTPLPHNGGRRKKQRRV